jgi:hypothetical protein
MNRLNIWLAFGLIVAGLTGSTPVEACPRWDAGRYDQAEVSADVSPFSSQALRPDKSESLNQWQMGMVGLGAIATVIAASTIYLKFKRQVIHSNHFLAQPELEHPELILVSLPNEARAYSSLWR